MIRVLYDPDRIAVARLTGRAYGRSYEPWLVQALREANDIAVELVLEHDGAVVGHICFAVHPMPQGWWSLCTVAVDPEMQGHGFGSDLVRSGLEAARQADVLAITVLGHAQYYRRFGFTRAAASNLTTPFSDENTLVYPIRPDNAGLSGALLYPEAFSRL
ncbi:GNAT family N-acetyltransferase [Thalassovita taeanensis]|uniref:Putative acetyltransferase n=1 Tax=Thalassovita taeanensis TaxID=657014 RepID=A0A1H9AYF0_9RHOB|nr:N-acetyltransferase [Thalassovita taeanensis]SEP81639.1 putative acetyltransferase [Thalassovita taeanensis]